MADKNSFPQIPSTVWWGLRGALQKTPNATIDDRYLAVQLDVQDAAARQYVAELKRVGIIDEEGKATPVASRWRHDETYWAAAQEIVKAAYPPGLIQVAPPGEADRQRVISWFVREGLGTGTANNKAATYLLISSKTPNEAPGRSSARAKAAGEASTSRSTKSKDAPKPRKTNNGEAKQKNDAWPLNINIQIHISADANKDQIESIFSAMKRYLHDSSNS